MRSESQAVGFTQDRYEYMRTQALTRDTSSLFLNGLGDQVFPLWNFQPSIKDELKDRGALPDTGEDRDSGTPPPVTRVAPSEKATPTENATQSPAETPPP